MADEIEVSFPLKNRKQYVWEMQYIFPSVLCVEGELKNIKMLMKIIGILYPVVVQVSNPLSLGLT